MEKTTLTVLGMTCEHCSQNVIQTLSRIECVSAVVVSLENKAVLVDHSSTVSQEVLKNEIEEIGFDVV